MQKHIKRLKMKSIALKILIRNKQLGVYFDRMIQIIPITCNNKLIMTFVSLLHDMLPYSNMVDMYINSISQKFMKMLLIKHSKSMYFIN